MTKTLDFLFDFGSPDAYLAPKVLPQIAERTGARVNYIPCLLGGIFKGADTQSPMQADANIPAKMQYERLEMQRFITRHDLWQFAFNPDLPVNTLPLMRSTGAQDPFSAPQKCFFSRPAKNIFKLTNINSASRP